MIEGEVPARACLLSMNNCIPAVCNSPSVAGLPAYLPAACAGELLPAGGRSVAWINNEESKERSLLAFIPSHVYLLRCCCHLAT
jgi:hypothetical protein